MTESSNSLPEARLARMGLTLGAAPQAVGQYAPWLRVGNVIHTSGQFPWRDGVYGHLAYTGRIGGAGGLSVEQGYACAQLAALSALAQLKHAVGDLTRIRQIVRIDGHLQTGEGFHDHATVLDGASDLFNEVLGASGRHTRSALGLYQTALDLSLIHI